MNRNLSIKSSLSPIGLESDELKYTENQKIRYYDFDTKKYEYGRFKGYKDKDTIIYEPYDHIKRKLGKKTVKVVYTREVQTSFKKSTLHFVSPYDELLENIFGINECKLLKDDIICTILFRGDKFHANRMLLTE